MCIGCGSYAGISFHSRSVRWLVSYADGKTLKRDRQLLLSQRGKWLCAWSSIRQDENWAWIWLIYRRRSWGSNVSGAVEQSGLEARFPSTWTFLLFLPKRKLRSTNYLYYQTNSMNNVFWLNQLSTQLTQSCQHSQTQSNTHHHFFFLFGWFENFAENLHIPGIFSRKSTQSFLAWALQASVQVFFYFFHIRYNVMFVSQNWYHQNHEGSLSCNLGILNLVFVSALLVSLPASCFL